MRLILEDSCFTPWLREAETTAYKIESGLGCAVLWKHPRLVSHHCQDQMGWALELGSLNKALTVLSGWVARRLQRKEVATKDSRREVSSNWYKKAGLESHLIGQLSTKRKFQGSKGLITKLVWFCWGRNASYELHLKANTMTLRSRNTEFQDGSEDNLCQEVPKLSISRQIPSSNRVQRCGWFWMFCNSTNMVSSLIHVCIDLKANIKMFF